MSNEVAVKKFFAGACNDCGVWAEILTKQRRCAVCHTRRIAALEQLADTAAMYCEQLPVEVRDALHAIPYFEKEHGHQ